MIPEKLGRYEIQEEIGRGAMGRVFRAFDPIFNRPVAIKALKGEILAQDDSGDYLRRFRREAQAVGALSHPAIVTIYDVGDTYFVMEYLEGTTLLRLLQRRGRFPVHELLPIVSPVADALDAAHKRGVIHRDIKPANIMVRPDGSPKIMDFGLAHLDSTVLTIAGQFLGSPSYMSPEQILGGKLTPGADIYSLAVVAYEMLTGKKPFEGSHVTTMVYKVVHAIPEAPRKWNRDLPEYYDDVFAQALAKDPKARFESASDLIAALNLKEFGENPLRLDVPARVAGQTAPRASEETMTLLDLPGSAAPTGRDDAQSIARVKRKRASPGARRTIVAVGMAVAVGMLVAIAAMGLVLNDFLERGRSLPLMALHVESEPAGAAVTLDGVNLGETPVDFPRLAPGAHTLRVSREGHAPEMVRFTAEEGTSPMPFRFVLTKQEGEAASLVARLTPKPAARSEPPAASVLSRPPQSEFVELGPGVRPPRKISGESPLYPPAAPKIRQEATVTLEMTVTEQGVPTDLKVLQSAGDVLDEAVLKAVASWRYEPAEKQGLKVRVRMLVRQSFRVES